MLKINIFRWFLLEIPNRTDLFLFIIRTIDPHNWSINLIRTTDSHIWSTHLIHTFDQHIWSTHLIHTFQKYKKKYWTSNPSHEFQDWPKKYSFLETAPRFISYRLSHKRAKLVNPLKTSSCDRRTDGRKSADNSVWKYAKKLSWLKLLLNISTVSEVFLAK